MCAPLVGAAASAISTASASTMFAVSLGVSALSTGIGYIGQMQQANAAAEAQQANLNATAKAANKSLVAQSADLHARSDQTRQATALDLKAKGETAAKAKATASATSLSSGLSFDALISDFDQQYEEYSAASLRQLGWDEGQIQRSLDGVQSQAQGRLNTVPRTPLNTPSALGALGSIGASALSAYDTYSVRDPLTGERTLT